MSKWICILGAHHPHVRKFTMKLLCLMTLCTMGAGTDIKVLEHGGKPASPLEYGLMFEDINHSGDGGMLVLAPNLIFASSKTTDGAIVTPSLSRTEPSKETSIRHQRCIHGRRLALLISRWLMHPFRYRKHCPRLSRYGLMGKLEKLSDFPTQGGGGSK